MNTLIVILFAVLIMVLAYALIVLMPVLVGKLIFRWSKARVRYIVTEAAGTIVSSVVASLVLTGLILLVGLAFKQEWAFSGGLLILYTFWTAIKAVRDAIRQSKGM